MERLGDWVFMAFNNVPSLSSVFSELDSGKISCCVLDGELILSKLHIAAAIQRMIFTPYRRTKNDCTELMLMFSVTKNISEALKIFGCEGNEKKIVVGMKASSSIEEMDRISKTLLKGSVPVSLSELSKLANPERIMSVYNITSNEVAACGLESAVVSKIATCNI